MTVADSMLATFQAVTALSYLLPISVGLEWWRRATQKMSAAEVAEFLRRDVFAAATGMKTLFQIFIWFCGAHHALLFLSMIGRPAPVAAMLAVDGIMAVASAGTSVAMWATMPKDPA